MARDIKTDAHLSNSVLSANANIGRVIKGDKGDKGDTGDSALSIMISSDTILVPCERKTGKSSSLTYGYGSLTIMTRYGTERVPCEISIAESDRYALPDWMTPTIVDGTASADGEIGLYWDDTGHIVPDAKWIEVNVWTTYGTQTLYVRILPLWDGNEASAYFIVGATNDGNNNFTVECTFQEAYQAYRDGKILLLQIRNPGTLAVPACIVSPSTISFRYMASLTTCMIFDFTSSGLTMMMRTLAVPEDIPTKVSDLSNDAGYLSQAYFIVEATKDGEGDSYTPECTFEEAYQAFLDGKILLFRVKRPGSLAIPASTVHQSNIVFRSFSGFVDNTFFTFVPSGTITRTSRRLASVDDLADYALKSEIPPEKFLFISMTSSGNGYVTDYTYEEIRQAIDDGMYPIIVDDTGKGTLYPLTYKNSSGLMFSATQGTANWAIQMTSAILKKITTQLALASNIPTVPTDVSAFNNDAGYLSDAYYIVTISYSNGTYVADRTYDECLSAYNSGKLLFATDVTGGFYPLTTNYGNALYFTGGSASNRRTFKFAKDGNNVTVTDTRLAKYSELPTVPTNVSDLNNDVGYLSDAYFVITATADDDTSTVYTPDCTLAEAWTAFQSGKILLLKLGNVYIPSNFTSSALIRFSIFNGTFDRDYTFNGQKITKTSETKVLSEAYYFVTVTQNGNTYTADHTYAEVNEAYQSGKIPMLVSGGIFYPLIAIDSNMATFGKTVWYTYTHFSLIKQNNYTVLKTTMPLARQDAIPTTVSQLTNDAGYLSETYYLVTVTQVEGDDTRYTADKTFEEVLNAYNIGKIPILVWNGNFVHVNKIANNVINFTKIATSTFYQFNYYSNSDVILRASVSLAQANYVYTKTEIDSMIGDIETLLQGI